MNDERAASDRALIARTGRICFWQGGSLWVGSGAGRTDWHSHHAHQVAVSLYGTCMFRTDPNASWTSFAGAMIPSHRTHEFEFDGGIAHLFVEPETREGRALTRSLSPHGISPLPGAVCARLVAMFSDAESSDQSGDRLVETGRGALQLLTGPLPVGSAVDARVGKAIEHLGGRLQESLSLPEAAAVVSLSPGRFRHLFVQETGTSFRAYLLWMRLRAAIECAMAGQSWTSAAHEAGFSDSAHLSRTFKRMFGISPVDLSKVSRAMEH